MRQTLDNPPFRIAVGIATRGRPLLLAEIVRDVARQTMQPDSIIVCGTEPADVSTLQTDGLPTDGVEVIVTGPGLPLQRNAILDRLGDHDAVLFLDDDFLMAPGYIAATVAALQQHPDLVATTGMLVADDSRGPGLSLEQGLAALAADPASDATGLSRVSHGYGCNMAVRLSVVREHSMRFDERLPLYAWSEDMDFTHRLARHGWIAKLHDARGVHLGAKSGRSPGRKLGYSQVANPIYLFRKGSYTLLHAARSVGRNIAANTARAWHPEPYVDRRGRLHGNALAMVDLMRGRLDPARILEL